MYNQIIESRIFKGQSAVRKEHKTKLRISKVILANKQFIAKARYMEEEQKIMAGTASFTKVVYLTIRL